MIVDVNILLYAIDDTAEVHDAAERWLNEALTGQVRIGFPWQTIGGFIRIATNPRLYEHPLTGEQAWTMMNGWLASPVAWVPPATERTVKIFHTLMQETHLSGPRVMDAQLAALAVENGVAIVSADGDFAVFPGLQWINPFL